MPEGMSEDVRDRIAKVNTVGLDDDVVFGIKVEPGLVSIPDAKGDCIPNGLAKVRRLCFQFLPGDGPTEERFGKVGEMQ